MINIKILNIIHGFINYHHFLSVMFWVSSTMVHAVTLLSWSYLHGHRTKWVDGTTLSCDWHSLMKWNTRFQRSLLSLLFWYHSLQAETIFFLWSLNTIVQKHKILSCLLGRWTIKKWTRTNFFSFIQPWSLSSNWNFSDVWNTFLYILFACVLCWPEYFNILMLKGNGLKYMFMMANSYSNYPGVGNSHIEWEMVWKPF